MGLPVTWFEIAGKDGQKLQNFYRDAFDWKVDASNPMDYGTVETGEGGIAGGITTAMNGAASVTLYIETQDIPGTLDKIQKLGGKTVMPQQEVADFGIAFALFSDPEGNSVGLWKQLRPAS